MKNMLCVFVICLISFLSVSCAVAISEDQASKIINDHLDDSRPIITVVSLIKRDSEAGMTIRKIIADGYVYHNPEAQKNAMLPDYLPTDKGKHLIEKIFFNEFYKEYTYMGAVVDSYVKEINEILIDNESKIAIITYTSGLKAIEPYFSSFCINKTCRYYGDNINKTSTGKIKLKKYDKGWRVLQ